MNQIGMAAEVQQLQYRIEELEEENTALTQEVGALVFDSLHCAICRKHAKSLQFVYVLVLKPCTLASGPATKIVRGSRQPGMIFVAPLTQKNILYMTWSKVRRYGACIW